MLGKKITKCPVCGGEIEVSFLYQYSLNYTITKKGRLSKRYTRRDNGSEEVGIASCLSCGEYWNADEFTLDIDDSFWDGKQRDDNESSL